VAIQKRPFDPGPVDWRRMDLYDLRGIETGNESLVDQNIASWNQVALWLSRLKTFVEADTRVC